MRPRPSFGDLVQQLFHVVRGDLCHEAVVPFRSDQLGQHRALIRGVGLGQVGQMHLGIALGHILEARRIPPVLFHAQRIAPCVNVPPQLLGPLTRGGRRPFRPAPQRHAPLPPGMAVIQRESPVARAVDADRKAPHLAVENLIVPPFGGLCIAHGFFVQSQSVHHAQRLLFASHMRLSLARKASHTSAPRPAGRRKVAEGMPGIWRWLFAVERKLMAYA